MVAALLDRIRPGSCGLSDRAAASGTARRGRARSIAIGRSFESLVDGRVRLATAPVSLSRKARHGSSARRGRRGRRSETSTFCPDLGLMAWALWFLTSGCGEELGWRGFALPRLQRTHSAMASSVLLAIGWAGWHLPAFFYIPSYTAMGLRILPGFFFGLLAGAIVLTWLYNSSGGSVLAAVLWHASFNFVTASPNAGGFVAAVTSTLVMVWAIVVVWRYDWTTLSAPTAVRSVRATREEKTRALPGDERIPEAIDTLTHGVTIRRRRVTCGRGWCKWGPATAPAGTATTGSTTAGSRAPRASCRNCSIRPSGRSFPRCPA